MTKMSSTKRIDINAKRALADTVAKCRKDIEKIQAKGGYPPDYSLGFTNALIFAEYKLSGRVIPEPTYYTRKTGIGEDIPKPVRFDDEQEELEMQRQEFDVKVRNLMDAVAKFLHANLGSDCEELGDVVNALTTLEEFSETLNGKKTPDEDCYKSPEGDPEATARWKEQHGAK